MRYCIIGKKFIFSICTNVGINLEYTTSKKEKYPFGHNTTTTHQQKSTVQKMNGAFNIYTREVLTSEVVVHD